MSSTSTVANNASAMHSLLATLGAHKKKVLLMVLAGSAAYLSTARRSRRGGASSSSSSSSSSSNGRDESINSTALKRAQKKASKVDAVFFARLKKILRIVVPTWTCKPAFYIAILTVLLYLRTVFSVHITEILGQNAQCLVSRNWQGMLHGVGKFALITVPASAVNSGLKYFTQMLSLSMRVKLSEHVNSEYLRGVNFYKACNLGGDERIENADQRVTSDIEKFSEAVSELYTTMFKPLLDVVLFTYRLSVYVGWQGPTIMYGYFVFSALVKRFIMPSFGKLVARESELEGHYRTAHTRLITNSEEIAFYDGSYKERTIIEKALDSLRNHVAHARWLRALVAVFDGLLVKYWASIAGYAVLSAPMIFQTDRPDTAEVRTRDYIRNSQYLGILTGAVTQLVLLGNKLTTIAGYTTRVSELLEMVQRLNAAGTTPFPIKEDTEADVDAALQRQAESKDRTRSLEWLKAWSNRCEDTRVERRRRRHCCRGTNMTGGGRIVNGEKIQFEHCDIVSPEGKLLVHDLNFSVNPGVNVMVTGQNGSGKSSLFRVIGELWPLSNGVLTKPATEDILFVPQKPYLVMGTLRDQIIYPHSHEDMKALGVTDSDLAQLLQVVDPQNIITTQWAFDDEKDWFLSFSGGQKQRVAMARLFYHKPKFAILDECTSAVSDEVEDIIYETCREIGITIFTVSHRKSLARHHEYVLHFDGKGGWQWKTTSEIQAQATLTGEK